MGQAKKRLFSQSVQALSDFFMEKIMFMMVIAPELKVIP